MIIEKYNTTDDDNFEIGIFGLGYESRSISCFSQVKDRCRMKLALAYNYWCDKADYKINKEEFESNDCRVIEVDENAIRKDLELNLAQIIQEIKGKVFVDISVMTRHRLSELLWFLFENMISESSIIIAYSIADFVEPPTQNYPVKFFGSIIDSFQPLTGRLNLHPIVVIGLGYEKDKALGAIGHLDPENVIFLIPSNEKEQNYKERLDENNKLLFDNYPKSKSLTYDVLKPYSTYFELKSLILRLKKEHRILLIPLGPKILAVISLIIAWEFSPEINVWRVSSEQLEKPLNRKSSGEYIYIKINI